SSRVNTPRASSRYAALILRSAAFVALALFLPNAKAQNPQPVPPDCVIQIPNTAANTSSADFPNYVSGCLYWIMSVSAPATVSAYTVTFQSAPMATNTGTPTAGAYVTFTGTVDSGANPITQLTGGVTYMKNGTVNTPFVRWNLSGYAGSGDIRGIIYGYK